MRTISENDFEIMMLWENDPEFWSVSDRNGPYSKDDVLVFMNDCKDLNKTGQQRWIITDSEHEPVGALDIFDYDVRTGTAALGILIASESDRKKGYATAALNALIDLYKKDKKMKALRSLVFYDNVPSLRLFRKCGFTELGRREFKGKPAIQFHLDLK